MRGWDEFELEVVRDHADNVVIVCSIENLDPMGVHTGDSVTVAPQMTLSDEAYQELRDAAISVIRAVGVDTGGSNIQFARDRISGDIRVIEMNPRVSRSSALASKATGYPIAKVAAKLAVGYTLDEIPNDLTGTTPASFEPTLDYVVVKIPRFAFEKFPNADTTLGTQMKSVGETMGIGRSFIEAFVKAKRGLEGDFEWQPQGLHPWFRHELAGLAAEEERQRTTARRSTAGSTRSRARSRRRRTTTTQRGASRTKAAPQGDRKRVVILGSGPNRIGQGVEFDYCCVHAVQTYRELGYEAVMVNCNPETVSTDYDTSNRLYFEPLDAESVLAICEREQPEGVVIQFGGQTPLKLARAIEAAGFCDSRNAVRRGRSRRGPPALRQAARRARHPLPGLGDRALGRRGSRGGASDRLSGARSAVVRPRRPRDARVSQRRNRSSRRSTACTVRRSSIVSSSTRSRSTSMRCATAKSPTSARSCSTSRRPACTPVTPPACCPAQSLGVAASAEISSIVKRLGPALGVVGLLNVQLAVVEDVVFVLEVNPRASRTVPFASKATGVNLVAAACRLAAGEKLADLGLPAERPPRQVSVKAAVLPFARFPGADPVLGPEMRATGEVMASASDLPTAFAKAERAAGRPLPRDGVVFLSVREDDKAAAVPVAAALVGLGFQVVATEGTARTLRGAGLEVEEVRKVSTPGDEPSVVDLIRRGRCNLVVNTPEGGSGPRSDGYLIREAALAARIPCITTIAGPQRPSTRSRMPAPRPRSRCRSGSMSRPRRERRNVVAVEAVGPYVLVRVARGGLDPGRPRTVLHARSPRPRAAAADVALPCAARGARVPARSDRPRHGALAELEPGESIHVFGPLGNGFRLDVDRPLLVGGGIGVAPFPYLSEALEQPTRCARLRLANGTPKLPRSFRMPRSSSTRCSSRTRCRAIARCSRAVPSRCSRRSAHSARTPSSRGRRRWPAGTARVTAASSKSTEN